jgi:hypothetical protein
LIHAVSGCFSVCATDALELAARIAHLNRTDDPEFAAELEGCLAATDARKKLSRAHFEQLHPGLSAEGR